MTFNARLAAASLMLMAIGAAACSQEPAKTKAPEAPAPATAPAEAKIYPFWIGQLKAVALRDGTLTLPAADGAKSPWANTAEVTALLTSTGQRDGQIHLGVQPLLIQDGDRTVLIDTGAGGQMGTEGQLLTSLREAGIEPAQVTDILISHAHGDHTGGLVANSALIFPNATIRMTIPEWADLQSQVEMADLVRVITPKVEAFAPGARITPAINALALDGHTAGHTGYEIAQGGARLIYVGDALHSSIISVQRPDWKNNWDADSPTAVATRQALLERAAAQNLRVYGVHLPFPGVGRIARRDDGFVYTPDPWGGTGTRGLVE